MERIFDLGTRNKRGGGGGGGEPTCREATKQQQLQKEISPVDIEGHCQRLNSVISVFESSCMQPSFS